MNERANPSEEQLQAIISRHLGGNIASAYVIHHHCNTHAYVSMEDSAKVVIRICDGPYWTEKSDQIAKFRAECYAWDMLRKIDSIEIPCVIAIDTDEEIVSYPFLMMTNVTGTPMCEVFPKLEPSEQIRLVKQLGTVAGHIHALPVDPNSAPDEFIRWQGHCADLRKYVDESIARGLITTQVRNRIEKLICRHSARFTAMDEDIVFLHGDFHFGNVLLRENNGHWRVSGLVDAELAGIGPRGRELRALEPFSFRSSMTPGIREAFLQGYGEGLEIDDYKLAYLTAELNPNYLNMELVKAIESTDFLEDLGWIRIFSCDSL